MYATLSYISLDLLYIHNGDEPSENSVRLFILFPRAYRKIEKYYRILGHSASLQLFLISWHANVRLSNAVKRRPLVIDYQKCVRNLGQTSKQIQTRIRKHIAYKYGNIIRSSLEQSYCWAGVWPQIYPVLTHPNPRPYRISTSISVVYNIVRMYWCDYICKHIRRHTNDGQTDALTLLSVSSEQLRKMSTEIFEFIHQ